MLGARQKTVVEDDEGLWLASFNRPEDKWNSARVEHAMLELVAECGMRPPAESSPSLGATCCWSSASTVRRLRQVLLSTEQARAIISDVEARVRDDWYRVARRVGVTERDCDAISGAFCYPGFRLPVLAE